MLSVYRCTSSLSRPYRSSFIRAKFRLRKSSCGTDCLAFEIRATLQSKYAFNYAVSLVLFFFCRQDGSNCKEKCKSYTVNQAYVRHTKSRRGNGIYFGVKYTKRVELIRNMFFVDLVQNTWVCFPGARLGKKWVVHTTRIQGLQIVRGTFMENIWLGLTELVEISWRISQKINTKSWRPWRNSRQSKSIIVKYLPLDLCEKNIGEHCELSCHFA